MNFGPRADRLLGAAETHPRDHFPLNYPLLCLPWENEDTDFVTSIPSAILRFLSCDSKIWNIRYLLYGLEMNCNFDRGDGNVMKIREWMWGRLLASRVDINTNGIRNFVGPMSKR